METDVELETERLLLRRWRQSDREPFARMNADVEVMRHFPARMTREESDALVDRIEQHFRDEGFGLYAVERRAEGDFIGFVGLQRVRFDAPFGPAVEIGWRLAPHAWGHGYSTEAARRVLEHAFGPLALEQVVSFTVPANEPSWRVMERIGMTHDPADDFDHPRVPAGHPLERHVLYRMHRPA
jgi:RimJ/RimL family protein N-acetyltransferase